MPDPILSAFSDIDVHRDYERFCSRKSDQCLRWMWIFCLLQGIFIEDSLLAVDSFARKCLFDACIGGWMISIVFWIRYFVAGIRAHHRVMKSTDHSLESIAKFVSSLTPAPPMPQQIASSSSVSSTLQQGNATNGQV